ncbi:MAG: DUF3604 domain-containing protein [Planctomycetes bacterium]|nr:DUF3604 domain-containing protein [Planctomycetota bacterium]
MQARALRSWTLEFEAVDPGVQEGGMVFFQAPPFWGWSDPQVDDPQAPGFTTLQGPPGLELDAFTADRGLLAMRLVGRGLLPGEVLRLEYGAGGVGARADSWADRESRFRFAVDADGDGVRELLDDAPAVEVRPGPPAGLVLHLDSSGQPGAGVRLVLAVLDQDANAGPAFAGPITLEYDAGLQGPASVELAAAEGGCADLQLQVLSPGLWRVRARAAGLPAAESNPLQASEAGRRILWADLHGHSGLSDGTGSPEDWWAYARRVAGLDVAALTDHDHWGQPFLDAAPALWERLHDAAHAAHQEGRFVALIAYEWTSWIHGHRHVVSFEDRLPLLSSLDPAHESPRQLWDALAGRDVLTFAHHSAGGPVATNWSFAPDPRLEPVTEVSSVHGSSEAHDSPLRIYDFLPGNSVRDALSAGYRLGFIGSGDGHDGHAGLAHLSSPAGTGGLAAILAEDCTRAAVLEALRARRCYATSGPRIVLRAALDGQPMGSEVAPGTRTLVTYAAGTAPLARLVLVRGAQVADVLDAGGQAELSAAFTLPDLQPGEFAYLRVEQQDGHVAWSSPFFIGPAGP